MTTWKVAAGALIYLAVACGGRAAQPARATPSVAPSEEGLHWHGRIAQGGEVDVHVVRGSVRAEVTSGEEAQIDAAGGACRLHVPPDDGRVRVSAGAGDAELVVKVPAGVRLVVHAVDGPVRASGIRDVDAHVVNGGIEIVHAARVRARSVNGPITLALDAPDASTLSTVNGDIDVSLPASADVDVDARSATGQIALAVPVTGSVDAKSVHGAIGRGGHSLRLRSVSGKISVGTPK